MTRDTLYIIGNGFDLHHGLNTKYSDFRKSKVDKVQYLRNIRNNLYGNKIKEEQWWCDFEEMLGHIDYNHLMSTRDGEAIGSLKAKDFFGDNLAVFFGEWVRALERSIHNTPKLVETIDNNSLFLTFNYTTLLEKIYSVPSSNIWHIHNSTIDIRKGEQPIVGHDSDYRKLFSDFLKYRENEPVNRTNIADEIIQAVAFGAKGVQRRIDENHDKFIVNYSKIKRFIAMGFSFNDIDMPYIKKLMDINKDIKGTQWEIYWHTAGEQNNIIAKFLKLGMLDNNQMQFKYW